MLTIDEKDEHQMEGFAKDLKKQNSAWKKMDTMQTTWASYAGQQQHG